MATTVQKIVSRARAMLRDPYRQSVDDATLLDHLNAWLQTAYRDRPDLYLGTLDTALATDKLLSDIYPLHEQTIPEAVDFIVARAQPAKQEEPGDGN